MVRKGGGNVRGGFRGSNERTLPWYGWVGMASLLAGEAGLLLDIAPIRMFFFGIAWWSYILVADASAWRRCGESLLRSRPREFWFLAFWSIPLWNLFELLNFRLQNWFYVNAPADQTLALLFNWISYATVLPALFETYLLLGAYGAANGMRVRPWRIVPVGLVGSAILGLGMIVAPLAWPRVAFPLIWGFAIFLGEPLCYWASTRTLSLARQFERGDPRPFAAVAAGGFCLRRFVGILEFLGLYEVALHRPPPRGPEVVRDASSRLSRFPGVRARMLCPRQPAERHPARTETGKARTRPVAAHRSASPSPPSRWRWPSTASRTRESTVGRSRAWRRRSRRWRGCLGTSWGGWGDPV